MCFSQLFDDKIKITPPISILHCSILRLCLQLDTHFLNSTQQNLITEWKDFFSPAVTDAVILQFKHILTHSKLAMYFLYFSSCNCICNFLGKSISGHFVKVEEFLCCKLLNRLCKEPANHFSVSELVEHLCSGSYPVQVTVYHLLTKYVYKMQTCMP